MASIWRQPEAPAAIRPSSASGFHRYLRIIIATKPAELPVAVPMKFELVTNFKTATQISLTIVPEVLALATKLIK